MDRRERKAEREAEKQAEMYKTTPPLTLDEAFTQKGAVAAGVGKRRGAKQTTPGAFGRDKRRMKRAQD